MSSVRIPSVIFVLGTAVAAVLLVKQVSEVQGPFALKQDSLTTAIEKDLGQSLSSSDNTPQTAKVAINDDEAAADWRRKAKAAALHALKLDRVRRWDEDQAHEIANEEHGWLKLAETARSKADNLEAIWKKQKLEEKKLALLNQMMQSQKEMKEIDDLEKSLPTDGSAANADVIKSLKLDDSNLEENPQKVPKQLSAESARTQEAPATLTADSKPAAAAHEQQAALKPAAAASIAATTTPHTSSERAPAHETIVAAVQSSLDDTVLEPSQLASGGAAAHKKQQAKPRLPGINAYSWWDPPAMPKAAVAAARRAGPAAAGLLSPSAKRRSCHDLYDCVGSLFDSEDKERLVGHVSSGAARLEQAMRATAAARRKRQGKDMLQSFATDRGVPAAVVRQNPEQPILNILQGGKRTHSKRLPGVATNRWGGVSFWNRLLGPVSARNPPPSTVAAAGATAKAA